MREIRLEVFDASFPFSALDTAARQLGYESGEAAVRALWEQHRKAFLADLGGLIAQASAPTAPPPEDEEPYGEPLGRAELVAFIRDVANTIEAGDSFEGSLEYHPRLTGPDFALAAAIRVGAGQGSMILRPRPETNPAVNSSASGT